MCVDIIIIYNNNNNEPLVFNIWFYLCVFYAAVVVSVDLFSDLL